MVLPLLGSCVFVTSAPETGTSRLTEMLSAPLRSESPSAAEPSSASALGEREIAHSVSLYGKYCGAVRYANPAVASVSASVTASSTAVSFLRRSCRFKSRSGCALTGAGFTSAFSASSSARQAAHCAKCPSTNSFVSSRSMSSS